MFLIHRSAFPVKTATPALRGRKTNPTSRQRRQKTRALIRSRMRTRR